MSGYSVDTASLGQAGGRVQAASAPLPPCEPALTAAGRALPGGASERALPEVGAAIDAWVTAWLKATDSLGIGLSTSATGYAVSEEYAAGRYAAAARPPSDPRARS